MLQASEARTIGYPTIDLCDLSREYWQENSQLFCESVGLICMQGVTASGGLIDLEQSTQPYDETMSVIFDARGQGNNVFTWQLGWTKRGGGRTINQYVASDRRVIVATADLDVQGRLRSGELHPASRFGYPIREVLGSPVVKDKTARLRGDIAKAELAIAEFEANEAPRLHGATLSKRRKDLTDRLHRIGFSPLSPLDIPGVDYGRAKH